MKSRRWSGLELKSIYIFFSSMKRTRANATSELIFFPIDQHCFKFKSLFSPHCSALSPNIFFKPNKEIFYSLESKPRVRHFYLLKRKHWWLFYSILSKISSRTHLIWLTGKHYELLRCEFYGDLIVIYFAKVCRKQSKRLFVGRFNAKKLKSFLQENILVRN
jgi:hypothetical protein